MENPAITFNPALAECANIPGCKHQMRLITTGESHISPAMIVFHKRNTRMQWAIDTGSRQDMEHLFESIKDNGHDMYWDYLVGLNWAPQTV